MHLLLTDLSTYTPSSLQRPRDLFAEYTLCENMPVVIIMHISKRVSVTVPCLIRTRICLRNVPGCLFRVRCAFWFDAMCRLLRKQRSALTLSLNSSKLNKALQSCPKTLTGHSSCLHFIHRSEPNSRSHRDRPRNAHAINGRLHRICVHARLIIVYLGTT